MGRLTSLPESITSKRPKDFRWVDYDYLQHKVQTLGLKSVREYWKWRDEYHPGGFPLRPDRIYDVKWSEIFGGDNCYLADKAGAVRLADLIPYWEAVSLVQPLRLGSMLEYKEAFDAGVIPSGIPRHPHRRYSVFYPYGGWKNWLGKDIKYKVESAKRVQSYLILYRVEGRSSNILSIMIHKKGRTDILRRLREESILVVGMFNWYDDYADEIFMLLNRYGIKRDDVSWLFSNVHEILFELGSVLEVFKL